jgi:hypothetical protein
MHATLQEKLVDFTPWVPVVLASSVPIGQITYVIRVVDGAGIPVTIQRAWKVDPMGIVNIGSGNGAERLRVLKSALSLNNILDWHGRYHHQLMRTWVDCDFDSLDGFRDRQLQVCWRLAPSDKVARTFESELIWMYKTEFADLPIGNLKT